MGIDNRLRRLRQVLCSIAFAVGPLTSMIVGIPLIGHSLAFALCPHTEHKGDSSMQRKTNPSNSESNRALETLPDQWRDFFLALESDTQDNRE